MKNYDVVVIGLGIMGSATLWHLARSGLSSLGIDAYGLTHTYGSSHGATRIFRRAYWEGDKYLSLLNKAHQYWMELQETSNKHLIIRTGGIFIGSSASGIVTGSQSTALAGDIPHEIWDSTKIRKYLPTFQVSDRMQAIYEPGAYIIAAEDVRMHMLNEAMRSSAYAWYGDAVNTLQHINGCIRVDTMSGSTVYANAVIITTGPWTAKNLLPELDLHLAPKRIPIYWFKPKPEYLDLFDCKAFPIFLYECDDGSLLYGVPSEASAEKGVKIGFHNRQQFSSVPDTLIHNVSDVQKKEIAHYVEQILVGLHPDPIDAQLCFYTMSPDESFIIGASKHLPNVFYASACSGHGFKFAPAIGKILSTLAQGKRPSIDISAFQAGV
jgi:sarcosine oxidase